MALLHNLLLHILRQMAGQMHSWSFCCHSSIDVIDSSPSISACLFFRCSTSSNRLSSSLHVTALATTSATRASIASIPTSSASSLTLSSAASACDYATRPSAPKGLKAREMVQLQTLTEDVRHAQLFIVCKIMLTTRLRDSISGQAKHRQLQLSRFLQPIGALKHVSTRYADSYPGQAAGRILASAVCETVPYSPQ
jgi:hypothetical protein